MRNAFADELSKIASRDKRIVLLSGDIGNRLFNEYKELCPGRFFNCGVAEANMISMAAGMAACGIRPVTYTITPFITTRCLEQIRLDVCYHNLPVVIVGVGAGLSYARLGSTHHSCEDIAFLRVIPNMTVICPADVWEVRQALSAAIEHQGPVYLRLGKKNEPVIHSDLPNFTIGEPITVRTGSDVCLLSTGNICSVALAAAEELERNGVSARVDSMHTVKPLNNNHLKEVFDNYKLVISLEEHSRLGGLGGSIAEWLSDYPTSTARLIIIGTEDSFIHEVGDQEHLRKHLGLTPEAVSQKVLKALA